MASTPDPFQNCLCLVCRQTGHVIEKCPQYIQYSENPDSTPPPDEPPWPAPPFNPLPAPDGTQALCERCSRLDELANTATLVPFVLDDKDDEEHAQRATMKTTQIPSLGPVLSLQLLSTCPLCRLLFDVSYLKDEDMDMVHSGYELVLVVGWTVHRLEGMLYWDGLEKGKGAYAKCVYTSMKKEWGDGSCAPADLAGEALDAFGLADTGDGPSNDEPALGVRRVNPSAPDYNIIKAWFRRCDDLHRIACRPLVSDDLKQIKLVHVETRKVVVYPVDGCDYVALSYVWGDVEQHSYRGGDILPTVPATLEDAMVVVRNLGKEYFWADSLCIDQGNDEEKAVQIALMSTIYSGAWATIICASSGSAGSGIPRIGTLEGVVPQLSCKLWGQQLLSMMPTLSQQLSWSPWAFRAWTYQEGLLSPRRLFFTNHQVYFECNSVQCCESLVDSNSPFHLPSDKKRKEVLLGAVFDPYESGDVEPDSVVGRGVLRDPFCPISTAKETQLDDAFGTYLNLVRSYTEKKMTRDADSLNAFSAMLARFEKKLYRKGFVQGLPVEDLPKALLWFHFDPPRRRVDFPAWSWAGWEGEVNDDAIRGARNPSEVMMPPLRVWDAGHNEPIYVFNPKRHIMSALKNDDDEYSLSENDNNSGSGSDDAYTVSEADDSPDSDPDPELGDGSDGDDKGERSHSNSERNAHMGSLGLSDDQDPVEKIKFENDPVFRISKEEVPWVLRKIEGDELRIEGIVIRLSFVEAPEDPDSDSETDDEYDIPCSVPLEGHSKPQRLWFYGHNAEELVNDRSNKEQEFLLVSREVVEDPESEDAAPGIHIALLLIDRDGDVAQRVGVASLSLDSVELLGSFEPERRMFKLC